MDAIRNESSRARDLFVRAVRRPPALISQINQSVEVRAITRAELVAASALTFRNGFAYAAPDSDDWAFATRKQIATAIKDPIAEGRRLRLETNLVKLLNDVMSSMDASNRPSVSSVGAAVAFTDGTYAWTVNPHDGQPIVIKLSEADGQLRRLLVCLYEVKSGYEAALQVQGRVAQYDRTWNEFMATLVPIDDQREALQRMQGAVFLTEYAPQFCVHLAGPRGSGKNQQLDAVIGAAGKTMGVFTTMGMFMQMDTGEFHLGASLPASRLVVVDEYECNVTGKPTKTSSTFYSVATSDTIQTRMMREMPTDENVMSLVVLLGVKRTAYVKLPDSLKRRLFSVMVARST